MSVTPTNEARHTATLANESVGSATAANERLSLKTFGEYTFDQLGDRVLSSIPESEVTFDTPFLPVTNEALS